jgi:hypothetical protein
MIRLINILREAYSEKTVKDTLIRWGIAPGSKEEKIARQLINTFDQKKTGIESKLDIVVLPDELKQNKNYLNIDKYSLEDMENLLKSLPENPEKIKKEAIRRFVDNEQIDKETAQSYVARFIANKDRLKYAVENGTEDGAFTKEEVQGYIPPRLLSKKTYSDPRMWEWEPFEMMMDALFPSQKQVKGEENSASTDADKIYDSNGIEIYKGDDVHKCISYNPTMPDTNRKKYGWCVTQPGNTNYDFYRFKDTAPTFYFVFDRSKSSAPNHSPFEDKWHAFVIQVETNQKGYVVTSGNNDRDANVKNWEDIATLVPSDTWNKIKELKDYFKPVALSPSERGRKMAAGKVFTLEQFKELSQEDKILYVQAITSGAKKFEANDPVLAILPKYKISYEGKTTTLANIAIDNGQRFPYSILKDNEALAKRYAIVRSRYEGIDPSPIPLPYVKYLDEPAKQKYLSQHIKNISIDQMEKYFGEKATSEYINKLFNEKKWLPKGMEKYLSPEDQKTYESYTKIFSNWSPNRDYNVSEEDLANRTSMPEQSLSPAPITYEQWTELSLDDKKSILGLINKHDTDEDYAELIYGSPYLIKDKSNLYALLPKELGDIPYNYQDWVLIDVKNNKIVVDDIEGIGSVIGGHDLYSGYPTGAGGELKRIYSPKEVEIEIKGSQKAVPLTDLLPGDVKEQINRMKKLANII